MKIDVFIFNYAHYPDALNLYNNFKKLNCSTYLLNCASPNDPEFQATDTIIKLPNVYYTGQWNKALEISTGDVLFFINSDVKIPKIKLVMNRINKFYDSYGNKAGIYAPHHYWTPWTYNPNILESIQHGFKKVPMTDSTIWAVSSQIAKKVGIIDTKINALGWGIEILAAFHCFKSNKLVVRDYTVRCEHPKNTAYNRNNADKQWRQWINKLKLDNEFWNYYDSRNKYGFGWQGSNNYVEPYNFIKFL
jgi:hypothetical protein